jgi:hypothetical protein
VILWRWKGEMAEPSRRFHKTSSKTQHSHLFHLNST